MGCKKVRGDLLAMDSKNEEQIGCDLATNVVQESNDLQVSSHITFELKNPIQVTSRGCPKSLREKHPKESPFGKKRNVVIV